MRLTLRQVFVVTSVGLIVLLGVLFYILYDGSRRSVLDGAQRLQEESARRISGQFVGYLETAEKALTDLGDQLRTGDLRRDDPDAVELALFAQVRSNPNLAEATLTYSRELEFDSDGDLSRAAGNRWKISVFRPTDGSDQIVTRRVWLEGDRFRVYERRRAPDEPLYHAELKPLNGTADDPTRDYTFTTPVSRYGRRRWSDLHWSHLGTEEVRADPPTQPDGSGATRPATAAADTTAATTPTTTPATDAPPARRVEVTVQQVIDRRGETGAMDYDADKFLGVLRVGLLTAQLDEIALRSRGWGGTEGGGGDDPHRVFVCDPQGRLVTRCGPEDCLVVIGNDIRFDAPHAPAPVVAALQLPALRNVSAGDVVNAAVTVAGRRYLVSFRGLERSQDWVVGVIAPEDFYLRGLLGARNRLLFASLVVIGIIVLGGVVTLRLVQGGLARVVAVSRRMRDFDFQPAKTAAPFQDLQDVLESIEQAKTAMRAMGKYVPVGLVRDLYKLNREPELGGDLTDVSLMFTDIMGFTAIAERLSPDDLALALGDYFAAMAYAVHANGGIIDKFIGDAVMGLWNVPTPLEDHPKRACAAALACLRATRNVAELPRWQGLPPLVTRVGLHRDRVMVGHFGAPDRLSYTVLGDGVNLASRLESLNKQYGTRVLASEAIRDAAVDAFRFRLLDVVVVKGKTRGVRIYELRGALDEPEPAVRVVSRYEEALAAYQARDFAVAESILSAQAGADAPSRVLAARCRELAEAPPPPEWDGVYVARAK